MRVTASSRVVAGGGVAPAGGPTRVSWSPEAPEAGGAVEPGGGVRTAVATSEGMTCRQAEQKPPGAGVSEPQCGQIIVGVRLKLSPSVARKPSVAAKIATLELDGPGFWKAR